MSEAEKGAVQPDLSALIGSLLSNPAALSMLSSLLAGRVGNATQQQSPGGTPMPEATPPHVQEEREAPREVPAMLPAYPSPPHKRQEDDRTRLLNALRPFLSPSRCEMVDSLLRIMELLPLIRRRR